MQNANAHSTATPVVNSLGFPSNSNTICCLLHSDILLSAIVRAKQKRQRDGRANAYTELLAHFHKIILPAFFSECEGNLSEASRLLGIHRETVKNYATLAEIDMSGSSRAGGAV